MGTMPLNMVIIPVVGDNSFARMDETAHPTGNFLTDLREVFLSSAVRFGKSRELVLAKEKCFGMAPNALSWARSIGHMGIKRMGLWFFLRG
jgi:hypothetical protein